MGIKDIKGIVNAAIENSLFCDNVHDIIPESETQREQLCDELAWVCFGGEDTCGVSEYHGFDGSGRKWRVHVYPYATLAE